MPILTSEELKEYLTIKDELYQLIKGGNASDLLELIKGDEQLSEKNIINVFDTSFSSLGLLKDEYGIEQKINKDEVKNILEQIQHKARNLNVNNNDKTTSNYKKIFKNILEHIALLEKNGLLNPEDIEIKTKSILKNEKTLSENILHKLEEYKIAYEELEKYNLQLDDDIETQNLSTRNLLAARRALIYDLVDHNKNNPLGSTVEQGFIFLTEKHISNEFWNYLEKALNEINFATSNELDGSKLTDLGHADINENNICAGFSGDYQRAQGDTLLLESGKTIVASEDYNANKDLDEFTKSMFEPKAKTLIKANASYMLYQSGMAGNATLKILPFVFCNNLNSISNSFTIYKNSADLQANLGQIHYKLEANTEIFKPNGNANIIYPTPTIYVWLEEAIKFSQNENNQLNFTLDPAQRRLRIAVMFNKDAGQEFNFATTLVKPELLNTRCFDLFSKDSYKQQLVEFLFPKLPNDKTYEGRKEEFLMTGPYELITGCLSERNVDKRLSKNEKIFFQNLNKDLYIQKNITYLEAAHQIMQFANEALKDRLLSQQRYKKLARFGIESFFDILNIEIKSVEESGLSLKAKEAKLIEFSNRYFKIVELLTKEQKQHFKDNINTSKLSIGFEFRKLKYFSSKETLEVIADYFNISKDELTLEKLLQDTEKLKTPIIKAFRKFVIDGKRDSFKEFDKIPTSENILGVKGEKEAQKIIQAYADKLFVKFIELNQLSQQEFYDSNKIKSLEDKLVQLTKLLNEFKHFIVRPDTASFAIPTNICILLKAHENLAQKLYDEIIESDSCQKYKELTAELVSLDSKFGDFYNYKMEVAALYKLKWLKDRNITAPEKICDEYYASSGFNPASYLKLKTIYNEYNIAYKGYLDERKDFISIKRAQTRLTTKFNELNLKLNQWLRTQLPDNSAISNGFSYITDQDSSWIKNQFTQTAQLIIDDIYMKRNGEQLSSAGFPTPDANGNCTAFYDDYIRNIGQESFIFLDKSGNQINTLTRGQLEEEMKASITVSQHGVADIQNQSKAALVEKTLKELSNNKEVKNLISFFAYQAETATLNRILAGCYSKEGRKIDFAFRDSYHTVIQIFDDRINITKRLQATIKADERDPSVFIALTYDIRLTQPTPSVNVTFEIATTKVNNGYAVKLNPARVDVVKCSADSNEYDMFLPYDQLLNKYLGERVEIHENLNKWGILEYFDYLDKTPEHKNVEYYLTQFYKDKINAPTVANQIIALAKEALSKLPSDKIKQKQHYLELIQFGYGALLEYSTIALASKDPLISDIRCSLDVYLNAKEFIKKPIVEYEIIKQVTNGEEKEIKIPQYALKRCDHLLEINRKALMAVADNKYYEYQDKLEQLPSDYLFLLACANEKYAEKIFKNKNAANKLKLEDVETLYNLYKDKVPSPFNGEIQHTPAKFIELIKTVNSPEVDQQSSNLLGDVNNLIIEHKAEEFIYPFIIYGAKLINKLNQNQAHLPEIEHYEEILIDTIYKGKFSLIKALELVSKNKRLCYKLIDKALDGGQCAFEISQLLNKDSNLSEKAKTAFYSAFEKSLEINNDRKPSDTEMLAKKIFNTKRITEFMGPKEIAYLMSEAPNTIEAAFQTGFFDWIWQGIGKLFGKNLGKINISDKLISPNKDKTSENIKDFINEIGEHKDLAIQHILRKPAFYETNYVKLLNPNDLAEIILSVQQKNSQENLLDFPKNKDIISQLFVKNAENNLLLTSDNKEKLLLERLIFLQAMGMQLSQAIEYADGALKEAFELIDKLVKQQEVKLPISPQVVEKLQQIANHNSLIEDLLIGSKIIIDTAQDIIKLENIRSELKNEASSVLDDEDNAENKSSDTDIPFDRPIPKPKC